MSPKKINDQAKSRNKRGSKRPNPLSQGPLGFSFKKGEPITPAVHRHIVESRKHNRAKIYKPANKTLKGPAAAWAFASNTTPGAPSIVEQARALRNDPQLIYQFVHDNIEWEPGFGVQKGALGALLDGMGNSFDQSMLLVELLREAGFTAAYVLGTIELPEADYADWFGTSSIWASYNYCGNENIPAQSPTWNGSGWDMVISHVWVEVEIDSTTYVFDPSRKSYARTAAVEDLDEILDYSTTTFMSNAEDGATIDSGGEYVQNINRANIRDDLGTMTGNLIDWIKSNKPDATIDDILGGRKIVPATIPLLQTTLPYQAEGDEPTNWEEDIPLGYKTTLQVRYPGSEPETWSIDETFTSDQLAGARLTLFFNGSLEPVLALNGAVIATGDAQGTGTWNSVLLTVTHNGYAVNWYDQEWWQSFIWAGQYYLIGNAWGNLGTGQLSYHLNQREANIANGGTEYSEPVMGEVLAVSFFSWACQNSKVCDLINRLTNCHTMYNHQVGIISYHAGTDASGTDLGGVSGSSTNLDNDVTKTPINDTVLAMHGVALEGATGMQLVGSGTSACTTTVIDQANTDGDMIYKGTSSNWNTGTDVSSILDGNGYDTGDLDNIYNWYIQWGNDVVISENPGQAIDGWTGWGYWVYPSAGAIGIINGALKGKLKGGKENGGKNDGKSKNGSEKKDPVDMFTGSFVLRTSDLTLGSQDFPYSLSFERSYQTRFQNENGPLGRGWKHSHQIEAVIESDGFMAMGEYSAIHAAASISQLFVCVDLISDTNRPLSKLVTITLADRWWIDQITNNVVIISARDKTRYYLKQPDGSYTPPNGNADVLTESMGLFTLTSPQGVQINFNSDGQIATQVFPHGVTVTYTYSSGKLQTVSNGLGRTLTLSYTGEKITSISDGEGRVVEYGYTDDDLTTFTDTQEEDTVYVYDEPGRLEQIFYPAFPIDAYVTNVHDSLGRVMSQTDGASNTWNFYLAGSRAEIVDPTNNSEVLYFDRFAKTTREIDGLGNETKHEYDGLQRLVKTTFPEGNSRELTYDEMNNVLTITDVAKLGSGLSNIVRTMEYDPDWNKVTSSEDGRGNITTFTYDETTGQLVAIEYPEVDSVVATVEFSYNNRGQLISQIDQMGVQTQFTYDGSTEVLLSKSVNTNWLATVGGTITVSDVVSIIVHDSGLGGGQKTKSYTVQTGNQLYDVAAGLAAAINGDTEITDLGITAKVRGDIISLATAPGNATTFTSSTSGGATEAVTLVAGLNLQTAYDYDAVGNVDELTDPRDNTTVYEWDAMRRLKKITEAEPFDDYETKVTYDENGNVTKVERFAGLDEFDAPIWQTTQWTYTVDDLVETIIDPATNTTEFTYNTLRKLWKREDAAARVTEFTYDELGRLATVIDPASVVAETRTYTDNGLLATVEDANENVTTFEYDGLDRLKKQIYADTTFEQFTRNANGNVEIKLTRAGDSINFEWDALNRLIEKDPDNLPTVTYGYDLSNRLRSVATPVVGGDPSSGEIEYTWDAGGRLLKEEYPDSKQVQYQIDENGNVTRLTYPDGYYVDRVFDELNRLTGVKLNGAGSNAINFEYDPLSRRIGLDFDNGTSCEYGFEDLNHLITSLTQTFNSSSVTFGYGFNNVNELVSQSVDDNAYLWHPTGANTVPYDPANELNQYPEVDNVAYSYNNNGCLTDDGVWEFGYDTENRLVTADDGVTNASYLYDPLNRQAQKEVDSSKTRFVYAGWQRIADYDGSDALVSRYVYGAGLDEPLIKVAAGGGLTYLHHDRIGSIVGLSDNTGVVTDVYKYTPWGESPSMSGTTFGFTGQRFDAETGLYYYKNRYYSPAIGRFLQPDPIGFEAGDLNLYSYVKNNPLNFVDPLGLEEGLNAIPYTPINSDNFVPGGTAEGAGITSGDIGTNGESTNGSATSTHTAQPSSQGAGENQKPGQTKYYDPNGKEGTEILTDPTARGRVKGKIIKK